MSILINLLPDLRQAKLREKHRRQLISGVSVMIWVVSGVIIAVLSVYTAGQKVVIGSLTKSISDQETQLQNVPGLSDALTGEQHLASLSSLYSQRVYLTKFFQAYSQADPGTVSLSSLNIDSANNLVINGLADSYASVAKLDRALTASNITVGTGASASNTPYFSNVGITSVSASATGVTFTLSAIVGTGALSGSSN